MVVRGSAGGMRAHTPAVDDVRAAPMSDMMYGVFLHALRQAAPLKVVSSPA